VRTSILAKGEQGKEQNVKEKGGKRKDQGKLEVKKVKNAQMGANIEAEKMRKE
jgi:hypothetical protein